MIHDSDRKLTIHELKIWPRYFGPVVEGRKTFEKRKFDRDYRVNDLLLLREWSKEDGYTGKEALAQITYILEGDFAVPGECLMSIRLVRLEAV
jgi:hypothetical protein